MHLPVCLALALVLLGPRAASPTRPAAPPHAPADRPAAYLTIPKLGITHAPIWDRRQVSGAHGRATVPAYGALRLASSAPFGRPGLSVVYGDDTAHGAIFKWLSALEPAHLRERPPFPGDEVQVRAGGHLYRYHVRRKRITSPGDTSVLRQHYRRPTLVLVSTTPYKVDTLRVLVVAQTM